MDHHYNGSVIGQARAPLLDMPFNPCRNPSGASSSFRTSTAGDTQHSSIPNPYTQWCTSENDKAEYLPISAPPEYPSLDFRPTTIRRAVSIPFCIAYFAISGCLFFGFYFGDIEGDGEASWNLSDVNTYLAAHFIPPAVGTITTIHIKSTSQTLRRMLPYMAMADRGQKREGAPLGRSIKARYFPTLLPNSFTTWIIMFVALTVDFVVPLKSTLVIMVPKNLHATEPTDVSGGGWTLYFEPSIALLLGLIYAGLALFMLCFIVLGPGQRPTGLKANWDPVSLSDFVALFHPLHATQDQQTEHSPDAYATSSKDLKPRLRLGYWQLANCAGTKDGITYGIRDLNASVVDISRFDNSRHNFHRHRMTFGRIHSSMATLLLTAVATYWVWICIIRNKLPIYHWPDSDSTYASTLNMYDSLFGAYLAARTVSVYFANLIRILISTLDIHYRWVQPFADMRDSPDTAPKTILLDYLTISPLEVLPMSWSNKHWKVFSASVASCSSWILPLLAAGALYGANAPDPNDQDNRIEILRVSMVSLVPAMIVSGIYLILVLVCWPTAKRASPRNSGCLADWYKLFYASHLRRAPEFLQAASGRDMTKDDLNASLFLKKDKYMFGTCVDTRGRSYIGFDVAEKGGESTGFVTKLEKGATGLKHKSSARVIELEEMGLVGR